MSTLTRVEPIMTLKQAADYLRISKAHLSNSHQRQGAGRHSPAHVPCRAACADPVRVGGRVDGIRHLEAIR